SNALLHSFPTRRSSDLMAEVIGREIPLLLISKPELMDVFQLLYFGNTYQDLSELVLSELGVFNYEDYALEGSATAFRSRQELERSEEHTSELQSRYNIV